MKIAVVGLGAVGGLLAARLGSAGFEVCALARGATLNAVRDHGLRVVTDGCETVTKINVSTEAGSLGAQDLVIIAVKAPALAQAALALQPLLGPTTVVMPAMNGVPWWFLSTGGSDASGASGAEAPPLHSVDPHGQIAALLPLHRVLGCVVHLSCASPEPGLVKLGFADRLIIGEPAGGPPTARVDSVCAVLAQAGFNAQPSHNLRRELWYKLWGNMTMNPVSALTGADSDRILDDPLVREFMLRTMAEAAAIGAQIGCPIDQSGEQRMAVTRQLGGFKTSMLQDALAGRALELDALVGAVHEIGQRLGLPTPNIGALLGLTRLMARERGLYPL